MIEIEPMSQKELGLSDSEYEAYVNGFSDCEGKILKILKKSISVSV